MDQIFVSHIFITPYHLIKQRKKNLYRDLKLNSMNLFKKVRNKNNNIKNRKNTILSF